MQTAQQSENDPNFGVIRLEVLGFHLFLWYLQHVNVLITLLFNYFCDHCDQNFDCVSNNFCDHCDQTFVIIFQ